MIGGARSRRGADVMRALVVIDENRARLKIVRILRMRQRHSARTEADEQESRNAGTLDPRLRAEHRFELNEGGRLGQAWAILDWRLRIDDKVRGFGGW
jgi:hypothetical protein